MVYKYRRQLPEKIVERLKDILIPEHKQLKFIL